MTSLWDDHDDTFKKETNIQLYKYDPTKQKQGQDKYSFHLKAKDIHALGLDEGNHHDDQDSDTDSDFDWEGEIGPLLFNEEEELYKHLVRGGTENPPLKRSCNLLSLLNLVSLSVSSFLTLVAILVLVFAYLQAGRHYIQALQVIEEEVAAVSWSQLDELIFMAAPLLSLLGGFMHMRMRTWRKDTSSPSSSTLSLPLPPSSSSLPSTHTINSSATLVASAAPYSQHHLHRHRHRRRHRDGNWRSACCRGYAVLYTCVASIISLTAILFLSYVVYMTTVTYTRIAPFCSQLVSDMNTSSSTAAHDTTRSPFLPASHAPTGDLDDFNNILGTSTEASRQGTVHAYTPYTSYADTISLSSLLASLSSLSTHAKTFTLHTLERLNSLQPPSSPFSFSVSSPFSSISSATPATLLTAEQPCLYFGSFFCVFLSAVIGLVFWQLYVSSSSWPPCTCKDSNGGSRKDSSNTHSPRHRHHHRHQQQTYGYSQLHPLHDSIHDGQAYTHMFGKGTHAHGAETNAHDRAPHPQGSFQGYSNTVGNSALYNLYYEHSV